MLIKICTKSLVTKSCLFLHSTQCCAAAGEILNISSIKTLMSRNLRLFCKQITLCLCVRQIYYNILGGLSLFVSKQFILSFGTKESLFEMPSGMLKLPNVSYCRWPIMASVMQLPFKFWFAADHTRHLFLVPKCQGHCRRKKKVTVL